MCMFGALFAYLDGKSDVRVWAADIALSFIRFVW